jgi:hypothetical protein
MINYLVISHIHMCIYKTHLDAVFAVVERRDPEGIVGLREETRLRKTINTSSRIGHVMFPEHSIALRH